MGLFLLAVAIIVAIESIILLVNWCDDITEETSNKVLVSWCDDITEETSNKDKKQMEQIVYKIEKGDLVGNIQGDNVTVILMNGDMNGNIKSNNGNVVLIRGDINGDVEANKVMSSHMQSEHEKFTDKLSTPLRQNKDGETKSKNKLTCEDCKNFQIKNGSYYCSNCNLEMSSTISCCTFFEPKNLKTGERVVGTGEFVNKLDGKQYHNCADCEYAKSKSHLSLSGIDTSNSYDCTKFNKLVRGDYCICDKFIPKEEQNKKCCASCNHYHYQTDKYNLLKNGTVIKTNGCYTCALDNIPFELKNEDPNEICCTYYVKRNPAKDVDSPTLPVKNQCDSIKDVQRLKPLISEKNDKVRCSDCDFSRYNNGTNGKYHCIQYDCTTSDALCKCGKFKPKPRDCINCEHYDFRNLHPTCNMGFSISFMQNVVFQHNPCNFFIKKQISDK